MYLFAVKLEALFKLAYPRHKVAYSETLREKYLSAAPRSFRKELKVQLTLHTLKGKKISWDIIKKCANLKDAEGDNGSEQESESLKDVDKEIIINVGHSDGNVRDSIRNQQSRPVFSGQFRNSNSRYHKGTYNSNQWDPVGDTVPRSTVIRGNYNRGASGLVADKNKGGTYKDRITKGMPGGLGVPGGKCNFCGRIGHIEQGCKSKLKTCFICGQDGHFFKNCALNHREVQRSQSVQPPQMHQVRGRPPSRSSRVSHDGHQILRQLNRQPLV